MGININFGTITYTCIRPQKRCLASQTSQQQVNAFDFHIKREITQFFKFEVKRNSCKLQYILFWNFWPEKLKPFFFFFLPVQVYAFGYILLMYTCIPFMGLWYEYLTSPLWHVHYLDMILLCWTFATNAVCEYWYQYTPLAGPWFHGFGYEMMHPLLWDHMVRW